MWPPFGTRSGVLKEQAGHLLAAVATASHPASAEDLPGLMETSTQNTGVPGAHPGSGPDPLWAVSLLPGMNLAL